MSAVGFYGGTFDPPHFGHINLAIQMLELKHLKAIYLSPACIPPHKQEMLPEASPEDRLEMVKSIMEEIPNFFIEEEEVKRKGISYTIDALKHFRKKFPRQKIYWIVAEDALPTLHKWKDVEEIFQLATPLVGGRILQEGECQLPSKYRQIIKENFVSIKKMDISSTDIRKRLKKGLYCGHLVPRKVLDYIRLHDLYSS